MDGKITRREFNRYAGITFSILTGDWKSVLDELAKPQANEVNAIAALTDDYYKASHAGETLWFMGNVITDRILGITSWRQDILTDGFGGCGTQRDAKDLVGKSLLFNLCSGDRSPANMERMKQELHKFEGAYFAATKRQVESLKALKAMGVKQIQKEGYAAVTVDEELNFQESGLHSIDQRKPYTERIFDVYQAALKNGTLDQLAKQYYDDDSRNYRADSHLYRDQMEKKAGTSYRPREKPTDDDKIWDLKYYIADHFHVAHAEGNTEGTGPTAIMVSNPRIRMKGVEVIDALQLEYAANKLKELFPQHAQNIHAPSPLSTNPVLTVEDPAPDLQAFFKPIIKQKVLQRAEKLQEEMSSKARLER